MKRIANLTQFKNILPYASEIFGVYQPLLGWKGKRTAKRMAAGFVKDQRRLLDKLVEKAHPVYTARFWNDDCAMELERIEPGQFAPPKKFDSIVFQSVA